MIRPPKLPAHQPSVALKLKCSPNRTPNNMAIISFSDQDTESCFHDDKESVKCSWASLKKKAKQKLDYLNSVTYLDALRVPPSNHLELLKGELIYLLSNLLWSVCDAPMGLFYLLFHFQSQFNFCVTSRRSCLVKTSQSWGEKSCGGRS